MPLCVAFLRGITVGGRRVKNDELCACFEDLGFRRVSAFLASGNVLFDAGRRSGAKLESRIEQGLEERLGPAATTFVRTASEVAEIASMQPFADAAFAASAGNLQVAILSVNPTDADREAVLAMATSDNLLALNAREMYWLPKGNISDSDLDLKAAARILGPFTIRTQRTMVRLAAKLV